MDNNQLVVFTDEKTRAYDPKTSRWVDRSRMVTYQKEAAVASLNGEVYIAGGREYYGTTEYVTRFNAGSDTWDEDENGENKVAHMEVQRADGAAAFFDGRLYVAGGVHDRKKSVVETYFPDINSWTKVAYMNTRRSRHQLVALGAALFAIGGQGEFTDLASVERFVSAKNTWTHVAPMATARHGHAAAAFGGALYVAGGVNNDVWLSSCERYDPMTNTWSRIADLPEPRAYLALACLRGSLYAIGGYVSVETASQSPPLRYDARANAWVVVPLAPGSQTVTFGATDLWVAVDTTGGRDAVGTANLALATLSRGKKGLPLDMMRLIGEYSGAQSAKVYERESRSLTDAALARDTYQVKQYLASMRGVDIDAEIQAALDAVRAKASAAATAAAAPFQGVIALLEMAADANAAAKRRKIISGGAAYFGIRNIN
jgi:N-acetylneuraminic acid mutarotase